MFDSKYVDKIVKTSYEPDLYEKRRLIKGSLMYFISYAPLLLLFLYIFNDSIWNAVFYYLICGGSVYLFGIVLFIFLNDFHKFNTILGVKRIFAMYEAGSYDQICSILANSKCENLHLGVISRPFFMCLLGESFYRVGNKNDGERLIERAIEINIKLKGVSCFEVKENAFNDLSASFLSEVESSRYLLYQRLWDLKAFRYSLIGTVVFLILLNNIKHLIKIFR